METSAIESLKRKPLDFCLGEAHGCRYAQNSEKYISEITLFTEKVGEDNLDLIKYNPRLIR